MPERTIEPVSVHRLVQKAGALWKEAAHSPFPDAVESGYLPASCSNNLMVMSLSSETQAVR